MSEPALDPDERARRAEEALAAALEERNRLWAELQRRNAVEEERDYWRTRAQDVERSRWWRAGRPLRIIQKFRRDPAGMFEGQATDIRQRRRGA